MENKKYQIEDGEHKSDVIVSWIITHGCPERCAYCISPEKQCEITDYETHRAIQNQMIETGLTKNRYIGGEPLMLPHISKLIKEGLEKKEYQLDISKSKDIGECFLEMISFFERYFPINVFKNCFLF